METMIKANRTKRAKVAILCMSAMFLCNTAIAQQTFTVSEKVDIVGNECTKTFNCYYGDNDERIMHGPCKTEGKVKKQEDAYNKYVFSHTESINYSHGKKEGKYFFQQKIYQSHVDVYHDYQINQDKLMRRGWVINKEITGSYKNDERDGVWKETLVNRDTLGGQPTEDNKDKKYTFVYDNGKLIELTTSAGAHYTFKYFKDKDGKDVPYLSGKYEKYTIKNDVIVSHVVRQNGDETEIDGRLKQFISDKENLFDYEEELLDSGYVLSSGVDIKYRSYPGDEDGDEDKYWCPSHTVYKIKKGQPHFASKDEIIRYLSEINEKDFEETYSKIMEKKYYHIPYGSYIKVSDLKEVQPTIDRYREMFSQIRTIREEVFALKKKIEENSPQDDEYIHSLIRIDGGIGYIYLDNFYAKDSSKIERWLKNMHDCLAVEKKYYSYAIKKDKQNIIAAKADTIRSIYGENSQVYQKFSEIYNKNSQYDFCKKYSNSNHLSVGDLNDFCRSVDNGLVIADNGIDYLRVLLQLNEIKEEITGDPYFEHVKTQYEASVSILGDGWNGKENGDRLRQQMIILEHCLDYLNVLPQFTALKETIEGNPYFNYVKTKYDGTIASLSNGWNGQENGDGLRQQIAKLEQYKNHLENIAAIEKNNEKIVQLAVKAKNIKKIYAKYYNSIQKEYTDNTPADYLPTIISNQNALIAALEANDAKDLDKTVKKGKAETMEDIIRIIKQQ